MRFDHVIYAAADLDATTRRISGDLGVPHAGGGEHEGMGTRNAILPLGHGYIEVLALTDPDAPPPSPLAAAVQQRLATHGDGLYGWSVCVDDVGALAERLGTPVVDIVREGFRARITGMAEAMGSPALPFFITRDAGVPDPGAGGPYDRLDELEIAGDAERLQGWLGDLPSYVTVTPGDAGVVALRAGGRELR